MKSGKQIEQMLNRPYGLQVNKTHIDVELDKNVCWSFCRDVFELYDVELPKLPHEGIKRIKQEEIIIPCVVLFRCGPNWHSGVMWPDGLHFIHANFELPLKGQEDSRPHYIVRGERITRWPWNVLIEGFYTHVV